MPVYFDTSALLKRYLPERNSDAFEAYFREVESAQISRLTLVELRSALARKRREGRFKMAKEAEVLNEISTDIQDGLLTVIAASDSHFIAAFHLMGQLAKLPLRSLDALHLVNRAAPRGARVAKLDQALQRRLRQVAHSQDSHADLRRCPDRPGFPYATRLLLLIVDVVPVHAQDGVHHVLRHSLGKCRIDHPHEREAFGNV